MKVKNVFVATIIALIICLQTVIFCFAEDEKEPNNKMSEATVISCGTTVYGVTEDSGFTLVDYYKVTIKESGYIKLTLNDEFDNGYHNAIFYRYDGSSTTECFDVNVAYQGETASSTNYGVVPGTYYIGVEGTDDSAYNFVLDFTKSNNWEAEPNGSIGKAKQINLNDTYYGCSAKIADSMASYKDDNDYFVFTLKKDGYVQIDFAHDCNTSNHDIGLYLYDGTSTETVIEFSAYPSLEFKSSEEKLLYAGTYYLHIAGRFDAPYNFCVNYTEYVSQTQASTERTTQAPTTRPTERPTTTRPAEAPTTRNNTEKPTQAPTKAPEYIEPETYVEPEIDSDIDVDIDIYVYINFEYTIVNNYIIILNYFGEDSYVVVPEKIDGYEVKGIGDDAFTGTLAEEVEIPDCVTQFGSNAFGEESGQDIQLYCSEGSAAQNYADEKGIAYQLNMEDYADEGFSYDVNNGDDYVEDDADYDDNSGTSYGSGGITGRTIIIIAVVAVVAIGAIIAVIVIGKKKSMI